MFKRDLSFIIVKIGKRLGEDEFYICTQGTIQDLVLKEHSAMLKKHNGIRPKNPKSYDCSVELNAVQEFRDNWKLIESTL